MNSPDNTHTTLELTLVINPTITALPRCLQILSRRGYTLTSLRTEVQSNGDTALHLQLLGPATWHRSIVGLLLRLTDVKSANVSNPEGTTI